MNEAEEITLEVECTNCRGFGVLIGPHQFEENSVVCSTCNGEGKEVKKFAKFTGRKIYDFVSTVSTPDYTNEISYQEFLEGKFPQAKTA